MSGYPHTDSANLATDILPPGPGEAASQVYALTATASYKALTTEFTSGYLGRYITLKANLGKVYFRFTTADSAQDAAIDTDASWYLTDGEERTYFIPPDSTITHLCIIAADTAPKLYVYTSSHASASAR